MSAYYSKARLDLSCATDEAYVKAAEEQVRKHLGTEPTQQEWRAIGNSPRVNGQERYEVWEFGQELPYWTIRLEFWAIKQGRRNA